MKEIETQMMEDNLNQVWNERDPAARLTAIEKLYSPTATLYHVGDQVSGYRSINDSVTAVQQSLPPDFRFTLLKPVLVNHNIGRAIWGAGPAENPSAATGMDIAFFDGGKISSLYVFLES